MHHRSNAIAIAMAITTLAVAGSQAMAADSNKQVRTLSMAAYAGYFQEFCTRMPADRQLRVAINSPHPLDFNVHYHVGNETHYLIKERVADLEWRSAALPAEGEYCFEVKNPGDAGAPFEALIEYRLLDR